jgi:hypothetical protein
MIYNDQPQMVQAAQEAWVNTGGPARPVVEAAFAAIDREALIKEAFKRFKGWDITAPQVEGVLVAAGIIPEASG